MDCNRNINRSKSGIQGNPDHKKICNYKDEQQINNQQINNMNIFFIDLLNWIKHDKIDIINVPHLRFSHRTGSIYRFVELIKPMISFMILHMNTNNNNCSYLKYIQQHTKEATNVLLKNNTVTYNENNTITYNENDINLNLINDILKHNNNEGTYKYIGRTIYNIKKNIAFKFQRKDENKDDMIKEFCMMMYMYTIKDNLKSTIPKPLLITKYDLGEVSGIIEDIKKKSNIDCNRNSTTDNKNTNQDDKDIYIIVYEYDDNYIKYLNDIDDIKTFEDASSKCIFDYSYLIKRGMYFDTVPFSHYGKQYYILLDLLTHNHNGMHSGPGELSNIKKSIKYPNWRQSGIADFGNIVCGYELYDDSIRENYLETIDSLVISNFKKYVDNIYSEINIDETSYVNVLKSDKDKNYIKYKLSEESHEILGDLRKKLLFKGDGKLLKIYKTKISFDMEQLSRLLLFCVLTKLDQLEQRCMKEGKECENKTHIFEKESFKNDDYINIVSNYMETVEKNIIKGYIFGDSKDNNEECIKNILNLLNNIVDRNKWIKQMLYWYFPKNYVDDVKNQRKIMEDDVDDTFDNISNLTSKWGFFTPKDLFDYDGFILNNLMSNYYGKLQKQTDVEIFTSLSNFTKFCDCDSQNTNCISTYNECHGHTDDRNMGPSNGGINATEFVKYCYTLSLLIVYANIGEKQEKTSFIEFIYNDLNKKNKKKQEEEKNEKKQGETDLNYLNKKKYQKYKKKYLDLKKHITYNK